MAIFQRGEVRTPFSWADIVVGAGALAAIAAVVAWATHGHGFRPESGAISLSLLRLPLYALASWLRMAAAYVLSLGFALVYAYLAAFNARAERYLIPRQVKENGIEPKEGEQPMIEFPTGSVSLIARHYTREAGVRRLEQLIGTVCRKTARQVAEGRTEKLVVTPEIVHEFLGGIKVRVDTEIAERTKRAGVAVGLAWTPAGGDVLFIEANRMKGKGGFTMTGQIGDVMKESMQAALTWVRSNALSLGLDDDVLKDTDLHIHVPAGAIPKDGPSAGVTMVTALVSLLLNRPIHPLLAMTGEITLSGHVLPVGGIKEKFLAAKRAGIRDVILPVDVKTNVEEDLSPEQIEGVSIHYAAHIEDVLGIALPKTVGEAAQDQELREEVLAAAE